MKRLFSFLIALAAISCHCLCVSAQGNDAQTRAILDKTAKVVGCTGGMSASFTMQHPTNGSIKGTIAVKGNKFNARTSQAIVWFNGKTQWTYMKNNDEVNISTPSAAQQQMMNPYTFVNIYKKGYTLSNKKTPKGYEVHLKAQTAKQSIQEMYITINSKTYAPSYVKMKHGGKWYNISIGAISTKKIPDSRFSFNAKEFPSAEVIDLR